MALALDGTIQTSSDTTGATSLATTAFTTTSTNDIIVVCFAATSPSGTGTVLIGTPTGGGLTWNPRKSVTIIGAGGTGTISMATFWALATSTVTNLVVTSTFSGTFTTIAASTSTIFAVSGASTSTPFDANVSLPAGTTGIGVPNATISTTNPNTVTFGFTCTQQTLTQTAGATYTLQSNITPTGLSEALETKIISSVISSVNQAFGTTAGGVNEIAIFDAIQAPLGGVLPATFSIQGAIPWTRTWYQSYEYNNTRMLGKDILPTRVLQTLPPPPVIWYRTWPEEGYVNRELVTLPFNQYDWPLPKVLQYYRSYEFNHVLFLGKDILPHNQYDWPLPKSWWWDRFEGSNQGLYISASPVPPALVFPHGRRLIPDYTKNAYIPYPIGLRF